MVTTDHATRATKTRTIPSAGTNPSDVGGARKQYRKGDTVKYQNGKTAYTVRALLGCGAFGEVYLVWSEVQQKLRAMKCTKFGKMTLEERRARFQPMCEEAFIMMELRHHPNIISIRFVKVSGLEFLVIMDLIHGSRELSEAYQSGSIWDPLDKRPPSLKTISQTTSLLSLLWLQLAHAMDHLHGKHIMVCVSCSFIYVVYSFFSQFENVV
jgi:serine/threonine protein kinase